VSDREWLGSPGKCLRWYKRGTVMGRRAVADFIRASGSEPFLHI
jgi:hypothetical protein